MLLEQIDNARDTIRYMGGHGVVYVLASTHKQAEQVRRNLRAAFPRATIRAAGMRRPENLVGLHNVLFLCVEEPSEEVMKWLRPTQGHIAIL